MCWSITCQSMELIHGCTHAPGTRHLNVSVESVEFNRHVHRSCVRACLTSDCMHRITATRRLWELLLTEVVIDSLEGCCSVTAPTGVQAAMHKCLVCFGTVGANSGRRSRKV